MTDREAEAARRIARFLADEHVVEAFVRLEARAVEDFREADTPERRETVHAYFRALGEVQRELRAVVERGEVEGALQ